MSSDNHSVKYRKDYKPCPYTITDIDLEIMLEESFTRVKTRTSFIRNPQSDERTDLVYLYGEELKIVSIKLNGIALSASAYTVDAKGMELRNLPENFDLEIETEIDPDSNTSLEGLYRSSGNYCTQCEAEGFRKITYYLDRPDVMARFTTKIVGSIERCPVMLSNGNLVEEGTLPGNRHYAVWQDPFPKPSYLFALVAGKLVAIEDTFITMNKQEVKLQIFVEERNKEYCEHAMKSLKKAMKWDEEVFGLAYDLDRYMIVAVDDFNMGAMENKGLNIFNSKYVLASTSTATDQDYLGVEGVIAHEYFHNWTGNRVTCRDWFQLSLKEGLTVFRDQEFSSDMNSRAVQRIDDVKILRDHQFREDAGPMAHPIRPDSYVEINNFYTVTVYNKGAEIIRMIHTLLGAEGFRKGMDLYFKRHDGQAVTCDDFVAAMADATKTDLSQFSLWYSQAGTPELSIEERWNEENKELSLLISQTCPDTPGQTDKKPFHIPLRVCLLGSDGDSLENETTLHLKWAEQKFTFKDLPERPVVSFNRSFSAPVKVKPFQNQEDLAFLMAHDNDEFNRWEASQVLALDQILKAYYQTEQNETVAVDPLFIEGIKVNLNDQSSDKSLIAQAITLPSEMFLTQQLVNIDPVCLHGAREEVIGQIVDALEQDFLTVFDANIEQEPYTIDNQSIGRRRLRNCCLNYLMSKKEAGDEYLQRCMDQFNKSANMTDQIAALKELANLEQSPLRDDALDAFNRKWNQDPLVMDKWFTLQAVSNRRQCLQDVFKLMENPSFSLDNPNKVRALIGAFCSANHVRFHDQQGRGYQFLADQIIRLNSKNPQIAARLLSPLTTWKRYKKSYGEQMKEQLIRISETENISADVYEIVKKSI